MGSSLSKRRASEDDDEENRLVLKKARVESWGDTDVIVTVGEQEFPECSRFLRCWSGYFEEFGAKDDVKQFDFPNKDPKEWELLKAVLHPFDKETVNASNYPILLPWFAELRCEAGLKETDTVILAKIVEPLLDTAEKERTPQDVDKIVTVLEHCVTWKRRLPRDKCLAFLRQVLVDPSQPYEGKDVLRMVHLLTKDEVCQKALWKYVKYYLPAELVEKTTFPLDKVTLVADNPLLLDVIEANMKLKKCLYLIEMKLKQVVAKQEESQEIKNNAQEVAAAKKPQSPYVFNPYAVKFNAKAAVGAESVKDGKSVEPENEKPDSIDTDKEKSDLVDAEKEKSGCAAAEAIPVDI